MITFLPKLPSSSDDSSLCECKDCDLEMNAWECEAIDDFHKRIKAGETVPAGQCFECGGLVYLVEDTDDED